MVSVEGLLMARRPRKETVITDQMLLDLINAGTLVIKNIETDPELWNKGRRIKAELTKQAGRNYDPKWSCERWTWRICVGGERRRIVRAKLVWIFHTKTLVPAGCNIHHGKNGRFDDSVGNLSCWTEEQHKAYHYGPNHSESEF